jgi:hypothetical protein
MSLCLLSKKLPLEEEKNKRDCSTKYTVIDRIKRKIEQRFGFTVDF